MDLLKMTFIPVKKAIHTAIENQLPNYSSIAWDFRKDLQVVNMTDGKSVNSPLQENGVSGKLKSLQEVLELDVLVYMKFTREQDFTIIGQRKNDLITFNL